MITEVQRLLEKYDYDETIHHSDYYGYGTAGFRFLAVELPPILVRVGIAVALLGTGGGTALANKQDKNDSSSVYNNNNDDDDDDDDDYSVLGVMITASHNTHEYNGVKLVKVDGGMMDQQGEQFVVDLVNDRNIPRILQRVQDSNNSINNNNHQRTRRKKRIIIYLGMDTREHSPSLCCLVSSAIQAVANHHHHHHHNTIEIRSLGAVTTPQLHWMVRHAAALEGYITLPHTVPFSCGDTSLDGYDQSMVQSYKLLIATATTSSNQQHHHHHRNRVVYVDCANGVGYPHLMRLKHQSPSLLSFLEPRNGPGDGPLNEKCGSEHVQKNQTNPTWYHNNNHAEEGPVVWNNSNNNPNQYGASFDGDADRIVFFNNNNNILLDGDKIACLIANFIRKQLDVLRSSWDNNKNKNNSANAPPPVLTVPTLGVVQTAYANGASTKYLQSRQIDVTLAKTGVKHVHQAAHDQYDIGIYFEANGHGTVLFGDAYYDFIHQLRRRRPPPNHGNPSSSLARIALLRLSLLPHLINQAVGDAISDLLLVDAILQMEDMTIQQWSELYQELPSQQTKVSVPDRTMIHTNDTETACLQPMGLQDAIDRVVAQHNNAGQHQGEVNHHDARAFVRPSGTENVVRVYAEATTNPQGLASAVEDIVRQFCSTPTSKI
jgi:phosphoacetylglucosamine mutase